MAATPTPFCSFQGPTDYTGYDRNKLPGEQPPAIPRTFIDAMKVREEVFVREQGVCLEFEMDEDDPRSCHWVTYASTGEIRQSETGGEDAGQMHESRGGQSGAEPTGTLRCVPFPHPPHPRPGGRYLDGKLVNEAELAPTRGIATPGEGAGAADLQALRSLSTNERRRIAAYRPDVPDRPTSLHDGQEPFVKLGRLAVIRNARGLSIGGLLVRRALEFLRDHPTYFNPNKNMSAVEVAAANAADPMSLLRWNGLVCVHAQKQVVPFWEKFGFKVDDEMGEWWEEGIPHVGMFNRLEDLEKDP
ncbi:hypothetical protein MCOR27_007991 [Pyricularia oryzae]|uniref:N-acetyltransferase domain-containing protein n=2 Tax=Pyricularia TaxID=48558 RepID=A0ABQ8NU47_PYRGI|nr:uncharacterized protein MGG_06659 [Pyricularia oryzae 70-15]KAH8842481.1 hypothetical protein MCOR01_006387 [Pyricularia oryzae]KAI6302126.1 hypothetical protein MCOR33_002443 [Pyricularia grisea]EHA56754.1 hypothetical protein MGG_06659 [Pyricularia oryzae 70-15]KAI6258600.1 hypothetical protein MCOR19_005057 [Pyricularia oryzae]KAI6269294.1 hypothetical protein MCOR26_008796 [Pyricularia oryzae]